MDNMRNLCCLICLNTHGKLISIDSYGLRTAYEQLTGVSVEHEDGLPQELCVECATLLLKFNKFRNKSHMAYGLLNNMYMKNYNDVLFQVNAIKKLRLELDNLHSTLKYSDLIVHLDIEPETTKDKSHKDNDQGDNDLNYKMESIDKIELLSDNDDEDEYSNVYVNWSQPENIDETNDETDDIMVEALDISDIDEKYEEMKKMNQKKKSKNVKKVTTEKLKKKLNKLLEKDDTSETYLEDIKQRNGNRLSKSTIRNWEILKKRQALVNECFFKKTMLSVEEQRPSFQKLELDDGYLNAKYKCELCFKGLSTEQYLHNHIKRFHSEDIGDYECLLCKMRFKLEKSLLSHMKRDHVYEYQCKSCSASFTNLLRAENHAKYHKGIKFVCEHCGKRFNNSTVHLSHVRISHPSDYVCVICGYSFIGETGLNQHIKRVHKDQYECADVPCHNCELKFVSEHARATHMRIKHPNINEKPMYNDRQAAMMRQQQRLLRAEPPAIHETPEMIRKRKLKSKEYRRRRTTAWVQFPVPCEACGLELSSGLDYSKHFAKEHPNMKRTFMVSRFYPHMCDQCGRGFQAIVSLKDHLLTHGSEYTIPCAKCDMKFKSIQQMKTHLYTHEEPVECHICGASISKRNLPRHLVMKHSEGKSFECIVCGKGFKTKGELKCHMQHVHMKIPWPRKRKSDGRPLRKRSKIQKDTRESEAEESSYAAFNDSTE